MIRNVIFDLGGVLYKLDIGRTEEAFRKLQARSGVEPKLEYHFEQGSLTVFDRLELGLISEAEFRDEVRGRLGLEAEDREIDEAWNALLVSPENEGIELVHALRGRVRLFMMSNTNTIHVRHVLKECPVLFPLFEKIYLSHELGVRKPGREIYDHAMKDAGIDPGETIFLDDSERNINGAGVTGLRTLLVKKAEELARQQPLLEILQRR